MTSSAGVETRLETRLETRAETRADFEGHVRGWIEDVNNRLGRLSVTDQAGIRPRFDAVAVRALTVLGDSRGAELAVLPPRSDLCRTVLTETRAGFGGQEGAFTRAAADRLKAQLLGRAKTIGLDADAFRERLARGAGSGFEEREWVKQDVQAVAVAKGLDLKTGTGRATAAAIVDRFYEQAQELIAEARGARFENATAALRRTLRTMVEVQAKHGRVTFQSDQDADNLTADLKQRYGATIMDDLAQGRSDALALDYPEPTEQRRVARALMSAATEHESFGVSLKAAVQAGERFEIELERDRRKDRDRARDRDRGDDFEL